MQGDKSSPIATCIAAYLIFVIVGLACVYGSSGSFKSAYTEPIVKEVSPYEFTCSYGDVMFKAVLLEDGTYDVYRFGTEGERRTNELLGNFELEGASFDAGWWDKFTNCGTLS